VAFAHGEYLVLVAGYRRVSAVLAGWAAPKLFFVFLLSAILIAVSISGASVRWAAGKSISTIQAEISATEVRLLSRQVENTLDAVRANIQNLIADENFQLQVSADAIDERELKAELRAHSLLGAERSIVVIDNSGSVTFEYIGSGFSGHQEKNSTQWLNLAEDESGTSSGKLRLVAPGEEAQVALFIPVRQEEQQIATIGMSMYLRPGVLLNSSEGADQAVELVDSSDVDIAAQSESSVG